MNPASTIPSDLASPATPVLRLQSLADDPPEELRQRFQVIRSRLVIGCGDMGLADDYCRFFTAQPTDDSLGAITGPLNDAALWKHLSHADSVPDEIVVFADGRATRRLQTLLKRLAVMAQQHPIRCLVVLTSLRRHLSGTRSDAIQQSIDSLNAAFRSVPAGMSTAPPDRPKRCGFGIVGAESDVTGPAESTGARLTLMRTGYVLSPSSGVSRWRNRLSSLREVIPSGMTSTFLDGFRLFTVIGQELAELRQELAAEPCPMDSEVRNFWEDRNLCAGRNTPGNVRQLTLLGVRRSWQSLIPAAEATDVTGRLLQTAAGVMSAVGIPWLLFGFCLLLGRLMPAVRQWHFHTLKPRSLGELLSLYNRHNCGDVQIAGYNNGVRHFGWKFPDRTVVQTTGVPGTCRLADGSSGPHHAASPDSGVSNPDRCVGSAGDRFMADAGLTLKYCIQELNRSDREFLVVPNYSWISMGTLFFVPVHGSGSQVSTLGDTIEDVLLYDGDKERFVTAHRGDADFREWMYHREPHRLLLRLTLRVQPKARYRARRSILVNPSAEVVLEQFADPEASHVEIRRNRAASAETDVFRYYVDTGVDRPDSLEMPRDRIGRIWDRLEETPVVSWLFHWLVRTFAFHVELLLRRDEFVVFWEHLAELPVAKVQLRRMLRDGLPHSACELEDCISADLFMTRRNRDVFCQFVATHLPRVRSNPGKQSL